MKILPRKCRDYLIVKDYCFTEVVEDDSAAVIIDHWVLPSGKYDAEQVSLLLLLPNGYPDAAPDMFYLHPWIKIRGSSNWPEAADIYHSFLDTDWQRWSRHWHDWRPGVDGIHTWLLKIKSALENTQ